MFKMDNDENIHDAIVAETYYSKSCKFNNIY